MYIFYCGKCNINEIIKITIITFLYVNALHFFCIIENQAIIMHDANADFALYHWKMAIYNLLNNEEVIKIISLLHFPQ